MNILFLRGFNNYFNRVIKKYSALADYQADCTAYVNFEGINFNPNDGVVTELVLGNESQKENSLPLDWENIGTPDYCVCYEMEGTPSVAVIRSRWFILESERLRSGQYRIALKRDVVAEHFDTIKLSPCFIEKGMVNDTSNALLFNKESMTYNQIKTEEIPLMDETGCGWVVGYVPKNFPTGTEDGYNSTISTVISLDGEPTSYSDYDDLPFEVDPTHTLEYMNLDPDKNISTYLPVAACQKYQVYSSRFYKSGQYWALISYKRGTSVTITQSPINNANNTYTNFNLWRWKYNSNYESSSDLTVSQALYNTSALSTQGVNQTLSGSYYKTMAYSKWSSNSTSQDIYAYLNTFLDDGFRSGTKFTFLFNGGLTGKNTASFVDTLMGSVSDYANTNDDLLNYNGMVIKYSDNKFYTLSITKSETLYVQPIGNVNLTTNPDSSIPTSINTRIDNNSSITTAYNTFISQLSLSSSYTAVNNNSHYVTILPLRKYSVELVPLYISGTEIHTENRVYTNRGITFDSNADIFAIPYGTLYFAEGTPVPNTSIINYKAYQTSPTVGLAIGRAIAERFSDSCYDLQLVPYCPSALYREHANDEHPIREPYHHYVINGVALNIILNQRSYQYIYDSNDKIIGFVLWVSSSKGTFDISADLNPSFAGDDSSLSDPLRYKLSNETQICRIASPNFNGQYEFSLAKNHGITKFNIDYTYKPYSPYIHVNPDFNINYLYGKDWDDARGLICGGDFSLAHITSYWQTYMNNNKNFSQIFDRQIQNMDVNNSIALEKQQFQATVGTITSAIGGVLGGGAAGATAGAAAGPWGAVIGGVVGAVGGGIGSGMASAYGAEKDRDWLLRQQAEARSFAIDMYGYNLGNIQAMPYSIKGTDALTNNNKIFPILEIYNATENELNILKSKIEFNGMTIMAVGNIQEYSNSSDFDKVFIKGQLIRLESDEINDDFHIADAIYQEINKGVYIPSGGL